MIRFRATFRNPLSGQEVEVMTFRAADMWAAMDRVDQRVDGKPYLRGFEVQIADLDAMEEEDGEE